MDWCNHCSPLGEPTGGSQRDPEVGACPANVWQAESRDWFGNSGSENSGVRSGSGSENPNSNFQVRKNPNIPNPNSFGFGVNRKIRIRTQHYNKHPENLELELPVLKMDRT